MPEPMTKYGTDVPIYNLANYVAKNLTFVNPNVITLLGLLMMIPILMNLYYDGSTATLICMVIFKQFLDCLDGSVARVNKKSTNFGVFFDTLCDFITIIGYLSFSIYKIGKTKKYYYLLVLLTLLLVYGFFDEYKNLQTIMENCNYKSMDTEKKVCGIKGNYNILTKVVHDNSVLIQLLGVLAFKLIN